MREIEDDAVVLRTYATGEADRIAVLFTRSHGKVRVIAKGVRKSTSRLGGSLEVLAHVRVDLVKTRGEFYVARHVRHQQRFTTLRADYERISAGMAVVEMVDAIPVDDVIDDGLFATLTRVLGALDETSFHPDLVPAAFGLRLLEFDGSAPVVEHCVNCARPGPLVAFDATMGGALCAQCRSGNAISASALELVRRIQGGDLAGVLRETPAASAEVATLIEHTLENHFGRRLRAGRALAEHLSSLA